MEGITILDMVERLGTKVSSDAVKRRLQRYGKTPFKYIGPTGVYTEADFEAIKDKGIRGRPKADSKAKTAQKAKAKKATVKKK